MYRRDMDRRMDLLTTYIQNSELQVITALSLISTLYKPLQYPLSLFQVYCVFIRRSLVTASNSGDSSASRAQVLSSQPSVQNSALNWLLTANWAAPIVFLITTLHGSSRKHCFQQWLYCCVSIRCHGNVLTDPLPRNGLHNTAVYSSIA
jgi:hypothetical protein